MGNKYLYEKFGSDKRIYNLNQGYWKLKFKKLLDDKLSDDNVLFKNVDKEGKQIYDANPIFTFLNNEKTRAIRIIQDEVSSEEMEQDDIDSYLMSAWIDTIQLYDSSYETDVVVEELVIALYLTRETVNKSIILIRNWLSFDLDQDAIDKVINEA